jgi:hypothetical protein
VRDVGPGWHVVTHEDLDDAMEPRTRRLLKALEGFAPHSALEAEARLLGLLGMHADAAAGPSVCIHSGPMATVSASLFTRTPEAARYLHLEGRPCTTAPQDLSSLLASARETPRRA